MHSLLLLATLLLPSCHAAHRPDTVPDTELRPARPLFFDYDDDDDTTQHPITMHYQLPEVPFSPPPAPYDYAMDYEDYGQDHVHFMDIHTEKYVTYGPDDESSTVGYDGYDDADELDGQQERLENSTIKNCICWRLVVAGTCLLCIISKFMLS